MNAEAALRIRPLQPDDLPRVLEIERQAFSVPWRASTFEGLLRRTDADLLAAERAGALLGYAVSWTVIDQSELGNVAVAPEARGRGVGRALLRAMTGALVARGARECFLEVRISNLAAQLLYRAHGFETVGRRAGYYARPLEDALVMRLALRGPPVVHG